MSSNELYSVWNIGQNQWATSTNYSTFEEAERLVKTITRQIKGDYVVKARPFGTMGVP